jgi:catechol 2,3-dioxygenase-like lactoylglutathione lyase family enzyme
MDTKLEVVAVPVSDVDRARAFYPALGWPTSRKIRTRAHERL